MKAQSPFLSRQAPRLAAAGLVIAGYLLARPPRLSLEERQDMAARFHFTAAQLPELAGRPAKACREVHPDLQHVSAWISSVGAAVALQDLDGDGLPNDACTVDPRVDLVVIAPVPGTGDRYPPFALEPQGVPYDAATTAPMGCVPSDMNEDGRMDVLVYYWGRPPLAFLQVATAASFAPASFTACEIAPSNERWYTNAATSADADGDGHADLIVGNYFPDGARVLDAAAAGPEQMQHSMSRAYNGGINRLLLWKAADDGSPPWVQYQEAPGVFSEEVARAWTLAAGAQDLDGDLLPEIYFANDFGPDRLLHNRSTPGRPRFALLEGRRDFTTPRSKVLGHDSFKGMGVDFGDLNGDGLPDCYVSNIAGEYSLEESHFVFLSTGRLELMERGIAPYQDASEALGLSRSGWAWEAKLADFDNDGVLEALQATGFVRGTTNRWPELHELAMGNDQVLASPAFWPRFTPGDDLSGHQHNPFFVRDRRGRYWDLAPELGLDALHVSRGIATADVDGDGDLDFAVANQWEPSYFYRNDGPTRNASLVVDLRLAVAGGSGSAVAVLAAPAPADQTGRPAIGATATLHLPCGRRLCAQVDGGNGHSGVRSSELHFGLADLAADQELRLDLRWRDAAGQPQAASLKLKPGRHAVLLGAARKTALR